MLSYILKKIIEKRMASEMKKVADEVSRQDPGLESEFRKIQKEFQILDKNIDWYCKSFPDSTICKERVQPRLRRTNKD